MRAKFSCPTVQEPFQPGAIKKQFTLLRREGWKKVAPRGEKAKPNTWRIRKTHAG